MSRNKIYKYPDVWYTDTKVTFDCIGERYERR